MIRWAAPAAVLLVLAATPAGAEDVLLTWENPTQNEDGTAYTNPAGTRIYRMVGDIPDPEQSVTSYLVEGLLPGTHRFVATAYNADGIESDLSVAAEKTATGFGAEAGDVYTFVTLDNRVAFVRVGAVPVGTPCDPAQSLNGRHAVDRALVAWETQLDPKPKIVYAVCG